jgi:hypothetical protein
VLRDADAVRKFAAGATRETSAHELEIAVRDWLESDEWAIISRHEDPPRVAIFARRDDRTLVLELEHQTAKYEREQVWAALGHFVQRMESPVADYWLVLPAESVVVEQLLALSGWVWRRMNLSVLLHRSIAVGNVDLGLMSPAS